MEGRLSVCFFVLFKAQHQHDHVTCRNILLRLPKQQQQQQHAAEVVAAALTVECLFWVSSTVGKSTMSASVDL